MSQSEIELALKSYSDSDSLLRFKAAVCECGERHFKILVDDNEGAAVRVCKNCKSRQPIGDSADYLAEAELEECECPCGNGYLELVVGALLYESSNDVRWIYLGCSCPKCSQTGCYADWKNEYIGYEGLLERV